MTDEIDVEEKENTVDDYINQVNELKQNTVSKEKYNKLKEENSKLAQALLYGNGAEISGLTKPKETNIDELRDQLFVHKSCKNDLEYFTKLLELREKVIADGQRDPFLPTNHNYIPNDQDEKDALRIADNIQAAIEYADGDPAVFTNDLKRRCNSRR